jgi:hypothetical protein
VREWKEWSETQNFESWNQNLIRKRSFYNNTVVESDVLDSDIFKKECDSLGESLFHTFSTKMIQSKPGQPHWCEIKEPFYYFMTISCSPKVAM